MKTDKAKTIGLEVDPRLDQTQVTQSVKGIEDIINGKILKDGQFFNHGGTVFRVVRITPASPAEVTGDTEIQIGYGREGDFSQALEAGVMDLASLRVAPVGIPETPVEESRPVKDGETGAGRDSKKAAEIIFKEIKGTVLKGHSKMVNSISFHPDGRLLASGSVDRSLRIFDIQSGECLRDIREHRKPDGVWGVDAVAFSPDGRILASGGGDWLVRIWESGTWKPIGVLGHKPAGHKYLVWRVAFSPDSRLLVSAGYDKRICFWDPWTGELLHRFKAHGGYIWDIAISPDGALLASAGYDRKVILWDLNTGKKLGTIAQYAGKALALGFSPDGSMLASSTGHIIHIYDTSSWQIIRSFEKSSSDISCLVFAPGGKILISGDTYENIKFWDLKTLQAGWERHLLGVACLALHPNGKILASGGMDHCVRLWDLEKRLKA